MKLQDLDQEGELKLHEGGAPPPLDPFLPDVDEGPMRGELRRQIAGLERQLTKFVQVNCPLEEVKTSATRGPGILTTAQLEEIRDELLATRARLHERLVKRSLGEDPDAPPATATSEPAQPAGDGPKRRRRGRRGASSEA